MSQSHSEVEALIKRAARGVNQTWGMADESAKAARWLNERGLHGSDTLLELLTLYDVKPPVKPPTKPIVGQARWCAQDDGLLCPVITGTAIADFSAVLLDCKHIECVNVVCPSIVLPFAAQASLSIQVCLSVEWDSSHVFIQGNQLAAQIEPIKQNPDKSAGVEVDSNAIHEIATSVRIQVHDTTLSEYLDRHTSLVERSPVVRASVDPACWERLAVFAHRTYAPASDESRRLGAGAGSSEND
ncbi:MAG: DUF3726 domain-containing protein [Granulosicoccus sp.]